MLSATAGMPIVGGLFGCGGGDHAAASEATQTAAQLAEDAAFWDRMRTLFVGRDLSSTMNVDVGAVAPRVAVEALAHGANARPFSVNVNAFTDLGQQRRILAAGLGAQPEEIGLTRGVTSGMWAAIAGIQWRSGDSIIYTDHEHPNVKQALTAVAGLGVKLHEVALPSAQDMTPNRIVGVFEEEILRQRC